ncbi:MAG: HIT domain-containing protein, partial [Planctomycetes bacterium]|nr:HIT domain-containing protein [Planctomycetota bacterium]
MTEKNTGSDHVRNLWAPWRAKYINSLAGDSDECFLCRYRQDTENDEKNFVLWRGSHCMTVLNRFPYTGGHLLVAPQEHLADLADLDTEPMLEMMEMLRDAQAVAT